MTKDEKKQRLRELYLQELDATTHVTCPYSAYEQFVPGEGSPSAPIVFIGEAPGETESKLARPFVGRSGKLLRACIKKAGLEPNNYFITNIVKWRPPHNRTPTSQEISFCFNSYLKKELEIIHPLIICTLGASALKGLVPLAPSITKVRGQMLHYDNISLFPTIHPAYALYNPQQQKVLLADLQRLKSLIETK